MGVVTTASASTADLTRAETQATALTVSKPVPAAALLPVAALNGGLAIEKTGFQFLEDLSKQATVREEGNGALVLGFNSPDGAKAMLDFTLGKLKFQRFLAAARKKLWWMTPEWGSESGVLPPETQFLLLELEHGGPYAALLPLIDGNTFRGTLRPPKSDAPEHVVMRMESGDEAVLGEQWQNSLYVAAGQDPFELIDFAVEAAAKLSGTAKPRREKQLPATLDVFGWCTWDAFYSRVSARGLHEGLASLVEGGVPPRFLIIDDGWQNTDVDKRFRSPPTSRSMPKMKQLQDASDEYFGAEIEVLADAKKDIPPSSSAGLALKQLIDDDQGEVGGPRHTGAPRSSKPKGKWLATTIKDTMTSISMNEDLYESDDEFLPPSAFTSWGPQSGSKDGAGGNPGPSASATLEEPPTKMKPPAADQLKLQKQRVATGTLAADEERKDVVKAGTAAIQKRRWPGQRLVGPIVGLIVAIIQRAAGLAMGALEVSLLKFYQWVVDTAPAESWPVRLFTYLATGPFREMLLEFYAASGDFTRRLTSVKANGKFSHPDAGPDDYYSGAEENLASVVDSLKAAFGVDYIYCWHGLPAYWSGISVEDPGTAAYKPELMFAKGTEGLYEIEPSMRWNPAVVAGVGMIRNPLPLYRDMHSYLASAGITGVKVDCQAGVGMMGSKCGGGPALAADFHAALEESIATHFPGNHAINCMAHSTENIYRWSDTAVARASDDFYPRDPASVTPHISACAFLSLFLSPLVQPDWDMFHSKHSASELHASARVLSGGSIYVSDYPGQHDFDILKRLVLPDGTILRAQLPGRPTRDSLFQDPLRDTKSLLKVWNSNKHSGIVGVFHLQGAAWSRASRQFVVHDSQPPPLTTVVRVSDVEPLASAGSPSGRWALYDDARKQLTTVTEDDTYSVWLESQRSTIITMTAVEQHGGVNFAAVGLTNMFNAGGAVQSMLCPAPSSAGGAFATMLVKGNGSFLMYADQKPSRVTVDGTSTEVEYDTASGAAYVTLEGGDKLTRQLAVFF